jgi:hypothetical protein
MDMRFGTWNVRSVYRADSLVTVSKDLSKCELNLVGIQQDRWEGGGNNQQENTHFSMERRMEIINYVQVYFCA